MGDILSALRIKASQRTEAQVRAAHRFHIRIDDPRVQPRLQRQGIKGGIDDLSAGQAKGDVGYTKHGFHAELLFDQAHCFERSLRRVLIRADRHGQRIHDDILFIDPIFRRFRYDLARDLEPTLRCGGDASLIERQRDDHAAVFAREGENLIHDLLLAVNGIDHCLAIIDPQSMLHHRRVRGINLQGERRHALKRFHRLPHHRPLVDAGQADVDVENVRAALLLLNGLREHIIHIVFPQCLLKTLFTRGIDALADDNRYFTNFTGFRIGGNDCLLLRRNRRRNERLTTRDHFPDIVRRRTAAATEHTGAHLGHLLHFPGKCIRQHIIDGFPISHRRHACIRIEDHRRRGAGKQLRQEFLHLHGPQAAVEAQRVHAQPLRHCDGGLNGTACEQLSLRIEGKGQEDGQVRIFFHCQHGSLCLIGIRHRLDDGEICACLFARPGGLGKDVDGLLKGELPHRREQLSRWPDIQRHKTGRIPCALLYRTARVGYGS